MSDHRQEEPFAQLAAFLTSLDWKPVPFRRVTTFLAESGIEWSLVSRTKLCEHHIRVAVLRTDHTPVVALATTDHPDGLALRCSRVMQTGEDEFELTATLGLPRSDPALLLSRRGRIASVQAIDPIMNAILVHGWGEENAMRDTEVAWWPDELAVAVARVLGLELELAEDDSRGRAQWLAFRRNALEILSATGHS